MELIKNEECEWIEYKTNYPADKFYHEIGEYISALSNSAALCRVEFAYLIFGVENKTRDILGTNFIYDIDLDNGEVFKRYLGRNLEPRINFKFEEYFIDGRRIVVLLIPAAVEVVTEFNHIRYIRLGSSKDKLNKNPRKEAELWKTLSGGNDITKIPSSKSNLTFQILRNYLISHKYHINEEKFEDNLNLRTLDGKYNLMAELLADDNDIVINVATFAGIDKTEYLKRDEFGGVCLLYALEKARDYIELSLNQTSIKLGEGARKEKKVFDNEAFEQAWYNACVHNRWDLSNNPGIYIYSDRIEIESCGGIPKNLTRKEFLSGTSKPVNDKLFKIFKTCGFGEESGHGVPSVIKIYGEQAYKFSDNFIKVAIRFNLDNFSNDIQETSKKHPRNIQEEILKLISANTLLTMKDLMLILRISEGSVRHHLNKLKDQGKIVHIGPNKGGHWKITR